MFTAVCLSMGGVPGLGGCGPGGMPGPGVPGPGGGSGPGGCLVEPPDGYCCGRYASYCNACLFCQYFAKLKSHQFHV